MQSVTLLFCTLTFKQANTDSFHDRKVWWFSVKGVVRGTTSSNVLGDSIRWSLEKTSKHSAGMHSLVVHLRGADRSPGASQHLIESPCLRLVLKACFPPQKQRNVLALGSDNYLVSGELKGSWKEWQTVLFPLLLYDNARPAFSQLRALPRSRVFWASSATSKLLQTRPSKSSFSYILPDFSYLFRIYSASKLLTRISI